MSSGRPGFKSIWRSAIQGNPQRASTVFSRPAAPSVTEPFLPLEGVIKNINTSPNNTQVSPPPRPVDSVPSPSMESPARKAAAHPEDQPIPSSLVGGASTMDPRSPPPLTTQHPAALSPVTESSRREATPPEGHVLIGPSRLAQGAAISDTASPAKGHIPPILSPPTVAEPKVFTSELGDLLQHMRDVDPILPSPPSIYELESCAIVPNTPNEPATALQTVPQPLASPRPLPLSPEPSIRGIGSAWSVFTSSIITTPPSPTPSIATSLIITTPPSPTPSIATSLIITTPPSPAPPEILPMDCGMQPSYLHSPGRGTPRHRMPPQGLDQVKVDGGGGCTQVGWVVPFSLDSRPRNSHQQGSEEKSPDGGYNVTCSPEIPDTSAPGSCSGYDSHLQSPANPYRAVASSEKPLLPQDDRPFHAHGWVEYLLPDESLYYVHPVYQVVTDVDLGGERLLDTMTAYLEDHSDVILPGQELWLRDVGSCEGGFIPLRWLVDHQKQTVAFYSSREANGDGKHHGCEDDRLDAKYRYWSFMEAHPAHVSLSSGAHQDALNALNWASTGGLLPSRHSTPAPFTREECQSLTALLQSIHQQGETPLHTHTVSKILLRVVCWRQSYFRPDKPLPTDAGRGGPRREDHPVSICSSAFMLTAGVYACLAAAIVLCISPTFMKIAGIGVILFLLSPLVSNIMSAAQFQVDNGPTVSHVKRALSMFSPKDRIIMDSQSPPAPPEYMAAAGAEVPIV